VVVVPCQAMATSRRTSLLVTFGLALAFLAAGYGALFSMLDEFRDEYGINESALGAVIGIGFFAGFVSQIFIAPLADRGHARRLVLGGMALNIAGLLLMAAATSFVPLLAGRFVIGRRCRHGRAGRPAHRHPRQPGGAR
jgi:predicted MFS family arabinose efflux permease